MVSKVNGLELMQCINKKSMIKTYTNLGARQPQWKMEYIRQYAKTLCARTIAKRIEVSPTFVYQYCEMNGIELAKRDYKFTVLQTMDLPIHEKIIRFNHNKKEKLVRPPAVYSNRSREQIIEELLNA